MKNTNPAFHYLSWPVQNVVAFTTTLHHPEQLQHSSAYKHFNLGLHVGDDQSCVERNRELLLDYLPFNTAIQWLDQIHGNNVESVENVDNVLTADASITHQKNVALAVMTADCLPIIISSANGKEIAAIHGGWKPLAKNIIERTLLKMHTPVNELYVWLGPCIGSESFEVGEDVYLEFVNSHSTFEKAFILIEGHLLEKKYLANLHLIATIQLELLGIKHIYSLPHCTFSMKEDYYSYRRQNITGRMATIICRL